MISPLNDLVGRWVASVGIDPALAPTSAALESRFGQGADPTRPGAEAPEIEAWERRHGFLLPEALRAWLLLSNGFYLDGPWIHPLSGIGPMVPFCLFGVIRERGVAAAGPAMSAMPRKRK